MYVPAAMTELWNCVREKMNREVIQKLTQEEVNHFRWNISIVSVWVYHSIHLIRRIMLMDS